MRRHRTRCRDVTIFQTDASSSLPKAGTPRCYERLTATDVDLGYVLEHGELPSWHPQQRSIWRLRRSPLLWWGRWRLRKAQQRDNRNVNRERGRIGGAGYQSWGKAQQAYTAHNAGGRCSANTKQA